MDVGTRLIGSARDAVDRLTNHDGPRDAAAALPPPPATQYDEDDEISGLADIVDPRRSDPEHTNAELAAAARTAGVPTTTEERIAALESEIRELRAPRPFLRRLRDLFNL